MNLTYKTEKIISKDDKQKIHEYKTILKKLQTIKKEYYNNKTHYLYNIFNYITNTVTGFYIIVITTVTITLLIKEVLKWNH